MKRFELLIAVLLVPLDYLMIVGAALAAYFLRSEAIVTKYRPVIFDLEFTSYLPAVLLIALIWIIIFALSGLYHIRHPRKIITEVKKIVGASFLGFAAITILIFIRGELFNSRFIVLAGTILAIFFIIGARIIVRLIKFHFYKKGIGVRRVILVGNDKHTIRVLRSFKKNYRHGYKVVKRLYDVTSEDLKKLKSQMDALQPDLIVQSDLNLSRKESERLLDFARESHIHFAYVADLFNTKAANTEVSTVGDIPLIEINETPLSGWGRIQKRLFDIIIGTLLLIIASPLMLIIAIAIKLDSKGPIFYKSERVGKSGKSFFLYKFRRFKAKFNTGASYDKNGKASDLEEELIGKQSIRKGPIYKVLDDPRNTKVGRFIEKTSLDELPQFFNVIKGEISLVGPRPHQPREVAGYRKAHKRIFVSKPGVTGLAQISGRSDLDYDEEARLDIFYIENWSLRADIAILVKTPLAMLRKHK